MAKIVNISEIHPTLELQNLILGKIPQRVFNESEQASFGLSV